MAGEDDLEAFRAAGRALVSLGLVRGSEGNLSTFDGALLRITRTGVELGAIGEGDIVGGGLDGPIERASSDLEVHRERYRSTGPGALAHAHPPGTVPEGELRSGAHGTYVFAASLDRAVEETVRRARREAAPA